MRAYKVVKLRVNVRLVENRVNSHDGIVIVAKVPTQYSTIGINLRIVRTTLPKSPKVEIELAVVGSFGGSKSENGGHVSTTERVYGEIPDMAAHPE
jgi:hypothetical protein